MSLTSSGSALALSSGVDLKSAGAMTLAGDSITTSSSSLEAVGDIALDTVLTSSASIVSVPFTQGSQMLREILDEHMVKVPRRHLRNGDRPVRHEP